MDDADDDRFTRQALGVGFGLLAVCLAAELLWFPDLADSLFRLVSGHGWDGSGLVYYQWFVFAPAALVFLLLAGVLVPLAAARSLRLGLITLAVLSLLHLLLLGLVIWVYSLPSIPRATSHHTRTPLSTFRVARSLPLAFRSCASQPGITSGRTHGCLTPASSGLAALATDARR